MSLHECAHIYEKSHVKHSRLVLEIKNVGWRDDSALAVVVENPNSFPAPMSVAHKCL